MTVDSGLNCSIAFSILIIIRYCFQFHLSFGPYQIILSFFHDPFALHGTVSIKSFQIDSFLHLIDTTEVFSFYNEIFK